MRKKKFKANQQKLLFLILSLALVLVVCLALIQNAKPSVRKVTTTSSKKITKTFYPTQYSDTHITKNAINTDSRYKNVVVYDQRALLANIISTIIPNPNTPPSLGPENGTWLWTPTLDITQSYRDSMITSAKERGIKEIYLSIDSYLDVFLLPDGVEKDEKKKQFDEVLSGFITEAHKNNIAVDAEAGWQNWAEAGNSYKAYAVINYVTEFNKTHKEKFRGFQYDVEAYLIPEYEKDKHITLYNFVNLIDQTVAKLSGTDLEFSVVIPDFYDGKSGETPEFSYRGENGFVIDHLLSVLERREGSKIIIMSYRNFSRGDDGTIDISKDEITKADLTHTQIIVAQETGDVPPAYITFHNTSLSYYNKQLAFIRDTFSNDKSFGGVATHYINAFLELTKK